MEKCKRKHINALSLIRSRPLNILLYPINEIGTAQGTNKGLSKGLRVESFKLTNYIRREKFNGASFPHLREDRAITKNEDYLQNIDKQGKAREWEKHIDQLVYELYDLTPEEIAIVEGKGNT